MNALPLQFLMLIFAGWVNRHQQDVIEFFQDESRALRQQLDGKRLRFTDQQRRRLARKAKQVDRISVSYKTPPRRGHLGRDEIDPNYALPDSAIQSLKRYFHKAFVEELTESQNFSVVETAGPDVLLISGHIVNLRITLPPQRDQEPDETVYASSSGQMTLLLDARDSISGESLVRVGQAQAIQMSDGGWYAADPVSNSSAVREIFDRWASSLRRELDQFHALAELPPINATPPSK